MGSNPGDECTESESDERLHDDELGGEREDLYDLGDHSGLCSTYLYSLIIHFVVSVDEDECKLGARIEREEVSRRR